MNRRILQHSFTLLNVDYVELDKKWNYRNILSPYYRLYLIADGAGYITDATEACRLEPGYAYIIPSFTLCSLQCTGYLNQYFIHLFEDSLSGLSLFHNNRRVMKLKAGETDIANFKRLLDINPNRTLNRSDNPKVYEKSMYYREYENLNNRQSESAFMETQGILLQLGSRFLASDAFYYKDTSTIPPKVMDIIGYIQLNLHRRLTVAGLAKKANQHPDYFSRLFRELTGERPLPYINGKRIERAQYLMTTSDKTLGEIADETGFNNAPHFSKLFKSVTHITPGQYKQQHHALSCYPEG